MCLDQNMTNTHQLALKNIRKTNVKIFKLTFRIAKFMSIFANCDIPTSIYHISEDIGKKYQEEATLLTEEQRQDNMKMHTLESIG